MSVTLSPSSQLGFQRPLTTLVKRTLSVSNHNSDAIAYKVKTTAPKQYCVRPNSGRIEPGETVEVQVLLQPMKEDPPSGTKCRDKFLVQSVVITSDRENVPLADLWGMVEKEKDSLGPDQQIHEQKIRCVYLPAADEPVNQSIPEESGQGSPKQDNVGDSSFVSSIGGTNRKPSPSASSPSTHTPPTSNSSILRSSTPPVGAPTLGQPRVLSSSSSSSTQQGPTTSSLPSSASPPPQSENAYSTPSPSSSTPAQQSQTQTNQYVSTAKENLSSAASYAGSAAASAAASAAIGLSSVAHKIDGNASSTSQLDEITRLKNELSSSQAEVKSLRDQLNTSGGGLRNRATGTATGGKENQLVGEKGESRVVEMRGGEGVPVQMVAGLCFAVFLFTWLFL